MIPQVFIFIGRSGCGKGTQAELLIKYLHQQDSTRKSLKIGTGALVREFAKGETYTQKLSKKVMDEGGLMPESIMVELWQSYLSQNYTGDQYLVFDGCPRKLDEAQLLDSAFAFYFDSHGRAKKEEIVQKADFSGINAPKPNVIYINVSNEWSRARLLARGRKDDTTEVINRRLAWFDSEVMSTIEYFRSHPDYNFVDINAEQPIEAVHKEIISKLGI